MIFDFDLNFLEDAAALVDTRLDLLDKEAEESPDPDSFGVYDQIEYITGFGLVACQTYATAIASRTKLEKREAFARAPMHRTGRSMVQLINAAANHWKHSSEWPLDAITGQAKRTLDVIRSLGVDTEVSYPVSRTLFRILTPLPARVVWANLIPFLVQWRDAVLRLRS